LARSEQGRRSFSFALLCCVHQRTGAALIKEKRKKEAPWHGLPRCQAATNKRAFARRDFFRRGLAAQCEREEACFRPRLGRGAAKEKKAARAVLLKTFENARET